MPERSPYLNEPGRLGDVIAAIQTMSSYKFYKLDFASWADRIVGDKGEENHWRRVLEEHPEFFRMDSKREKASLVWRRNRQKLFNVDTEAQINREQFRQLTDEQKSRISRMPLASAEVALLLDAAIKLHSSAFEHKKDRRWWIPTIASFVAGIVGAFLGAGSNHGAVKPPLGAPSIAAPSISTKSP